MNQKFVVFALLLGELLSSAPSQAQSRMVTINGIRMSDRQISQLDYYACARIPNGNYWLNLANGAWGYVGSWQVQGHFGDQCNAWGNGQARQTRKSLSERGLLYSPGEILNGR